MTDAAPSGEQEAVAGEGLRKAAIALYAAPFSFRYGYIYDAKHRMVSDNKGQDVTQRIRGWGRISYLPRAEELQDAVGQVVADALTQYWMASTHPQPAEGAQDARDADLLDFLDRPGVELSVDFDPEPKDDAHIVVHRVSGGRNDREWTELGRGKTAREAIAAAMRSAKP